MVSDRSVGRGIAGEKVGRGRLGTQGSEPKEEDVRGQEGGEVIGRRKQEGTAVVARPDMRGMIAGGSGWKVC